MCMTDPISDMLTRIRNGIHARKRTISMPSSKFKVEVARVLRDEGYLAGYEEKEEGCKKSLFISLKYGPKGEKVIRNIRRMSTPGRRVYHKKNDLPHVVDGMGIAIVSTSRGLMTDKRARTEGLGGEIVCQVF